MRDMGRIQGSAAQAKNLIIGADTVYVHTDIQPVTEDGEVVDNLFSYNEVQYGKDEYIELMDKQVSDLNAQLTSTQLALVEVYELIGG